MNIHSNARSCPASRALLVRRVAELGSTVAEAAAALGLSERRAHVWLKRGRGAPADLHDRSSRPLRSPTRTSLQTMLRIILLRVQRLSLDAIAERVRPSRATIARILKQVDLGRLKNLDPKEPVVRYEYAQPGGLLHLDIKRLGRFDRVGKRFGGHRSARRAGWEYVHIAIDDHSRVAYVEIRQSKQAAEAIAFLRRAAAWFAERGVTVERVMIDNGSCYVAKTFRKACADAGLRHIRIKPYRPRTNGKAERFVQTLCREWAYARPYGSSRERGAALPRWMCRYNERRPHTSLGGKPPISRLEVTP